MPRHVVRRDGSTNTSDEMVKTPVEHGAKHSDGSNVAAPAMMGGTPGMPEDPNVPLTQIGRDIVPAKEFKENGPPKVQRKFQIISGPFAVLYGGVMTKIIPGKVYTEGTVDLDLLRSQGVKIEEITEPAALASPA
jgi:hypothetical protein